MNITQVKINAFESDSKMKAYATITLENEFVVTGLRVLDGVNGYFVSMPSRKNSKPNDGSTDYKAYIDTAYPITKEFRTVIQTAVLTAYRDYMEREDNPLEKNAAQKEYDRNESHPSIDVSEDDLPFG